MLGRSRGLGRALTATSSGPIARWLSASWACSRMSPTSARAARAILRSYSSRRASPTRSASF
eukprot:15481311-Alexandrium_andersonii.AAC.1